MELREIVPVNPFVIQAENVYNIMQMTGLPIETLLIQLIPIAKSFARPPISGYQVGVAALGKSGNIYLGVNLEFSDLPLNASVHGEQFLITNARNHGETEIVMIALSAAPCGHCRQFMNEMNGNEELKILIPNLPPHPFSALLPDAFGPKDLGIQAQLLDQSKEWPSLFNESSLTSHAIKAALHSYAPYSKAKSGVAIRTIAGEIYTGSYLENAAFNPSLSPLQAAVVNLVANLQDYKEISEVILVEQVKAKISQESSTRALLNSLAPHAQFKIEKRNF